MVEQNTCQPGCRHCTRIPGLVEVGTCYAIKVLHGAVFPETGQREELSDDLTEFGLESTPQLNDVSFSGYEEL